MEPHEKNARSHKVTLLVSAATLAGINSYDVTDWKLGDDTWVRLAAVAGVNPPRSEESRSMVISRLLDYERLVEKNVDEDPFAGLPTR